MASIDATARPYEPAVVFHQGGLRNVRDLGCGFIIPQADPSQKDNLQAGHADGPCMPRGAPTTSRSGQAPRP